MCDGAAEVGGLWVPVRQPAERCNRHGISELGACCELRFPFVAWLHAV